MDIHETILISIDNLVNFAKNNNEKNNINTGLGEIIIEGLEYQIQLSFIVDKKLWCKEDEVRYSEVVKIHD